MTWIFTVFTEKLENSLETVHQLHDQLKFTTARNSQLYENYLARGELLAHMRCSTNTPGCRSAKLLGTCFGKWREWLSTEVCTIFVADVTERQLNFFNCRNICGMWNLLLDIIMTKQ
jgi:hypothetical protein